ncbi:hypothetical protein NP493_834g01002 [Ridgeia piscesae]|uniref:Uncharacterized protein n=1 Tax=Ridgeia piscesae TaxID=27915 RepID=A0AAD9KLY4_RIDPI|nr:hypothetical protein NP493_834g01002 [Ridgeia piscesae]
MSLKVEKHELERVCQELAREMACLTHAQRKLRGGAIMRCRYCPFGASDARTMYSHYKFHEQVLSSQCK